MAVFGSASEGFSQKNINCSVEESLRRFQNVFEASKNDNVKIRGYVSFVKFNNSKESFLTQFACLELIDINWYAKYSILMGKTSSNFRYLSK